MNKIKIANRNRFDQYLHQYSNMENFKVSIYFFSIYLYTMKQELHYYIMYIGKQYTNNIR